MYTEFEREIDSDFVANQAGKITQKDLEKALEKEEEIKNKFHNYSSLKRFYDDARDLFALIADYLKKDYRKAPFWAIAAAGFSLLYVFNPLDMIPDFLPVIGYMDDAAVIAVTLILLEKDLEKYRVWKRGN